MFSKKSLCGLVSALYRPVQRRFPLRISPPHIRTVLQQQESHIRGRRGTFSDLDQPHRLLNLAIHGEVQGTLAKIIRCIDVGPLKEQAPAPLRNPDCQQP